MAGQVSLYFTPCYIYEVQYTSHVLQSYTQEPHVAVEFFVLHPKNKTKNI